MLVSQLGVDPYGDGGVLFKEAVFTLGMSVPQVRLRHHLPFGTVRPNGRLLLS